MDGTSNIEHDRWMEKIAHALRSFRMASLRITEQAGARRPSDGPNADTGPART